MSLSKTIRSGKEYRKEFGGSKRYDTTCRNHGSCPWCKGNRLLWRKKRDIDSKNQD